MGFNFSFYDELHSNVSGSFYYWGQRSEEETKVK